MEHETFAAGQDGEREDQEVDFDNLSAYEGGEGEELLVGLDDDEEDGVKENDKDEDEDDD
jgi:hypothetical protein